MFVKRTTMESKEDHRRRLDEAITQFLNNGGKIKKVKFTFDDYLEQHRKRHGSK